MKSERKPLIYVLEDDDTIREFVIYALRGADFEAEGFGLPSELWRAFGGAFAVAEGEQESPVILPDAILLDVMLPEESGMEVLQKLKAQKRTRGIPVAMLTAKDSEQDKVAGLDGGADDYISKPFGTMELLARVRALVRRGTYGQRGVSEGDGESVKYDGNATAEWYKCRGLELLPEEHRVMVQGKEVTLTLKEFDMLAYLAQNQGKVVTRDKLLAAIWGYEFAGESRTVDVHVGTLRSKLGQCGALVETVRGVGYRLHKAGGDGAEDSCSEIGGDALGTLGVTDASGSGSCKTTGETVPVPTADAEEASHE